MGGGKMVQMMEKKQLKPLKIANARACVYDTFQNEIKARHFYPNGKYFILKLKPNAKLFFGIADFRNSRAFSCIQMFALVA